MKDYTIYMKKYVIIHGAPEETMEYFRDSKSIRYLGNHDFLIEVDEYNRILEEHEADSQSKD